MGFHTIKLQKEINHYISSLLKSFASFKKWTEIYNVVHWKTTAREHIIDVKTDAKSQGARFECMQW